MKLVQCAACLSHSVMSSSLKPLDYSPQGLSVHEDSPGKYTEWVAMPSSRGSSQPRDQTQVSYIAGALLSETQGSPACPGSQANEWEFKLQALTHRTTVFSRRLW